MTEEPAEQQPPKSPGVAGSAADPPQDLSGEEVGPPAARRGTHRGAALVAAGILLSRISGLVRERVFAYCFGASLYADVFRAALRMPNVLQNLLGEGTLSASFIPVYAELLEQGRKREAGKVAGALFALLAALVAAIVLVGIFLAPVAVAIFLPGFEGERRELAITCTRIIFPMAGTLVLSAWALGILNSHRRFFLSYVAPVLWNAAIITTLLLGVGRTDAHGLVVAAAWGALAGGILQFAIQLPWLLRLERNLQLRWAPRLPDVQEILRNAGPAILGRGVVQVGSYVDLVLASLLATGAVAVLGYAQTLYMLPVSLFGMSVAAAELPELARRRGHAESVLRERLRAGTRRIAFLVIPAAIGYLILGEMVAGALYQTGDFGPRETTEVYIVLAAYALGLVAATGSRLYASAFFALHDTRTPARVALLRVLFASALVLLIIFPGHDLLLAGSARDAAWLGLGASAAAWVEWAVLRHRLGRRIGSLAVGSWVLPRMLLAAAAAGIAVGSCAQLLWPIEQPLFRALLYLPAYGLLYFAATLLLGLDDLRGIWRSRQQA
jgi:putative peptidoglycan lipid II flippase